MKTLLFSLLALTLVACGEKKKTEKAENTSEETTQDETKQPTPEKKIEDPIGAKYLEKETGEIIILGKGNALYYKSNKDTQAILMTNKGDVGEDCNLFVFPAKPDEDYIICTAKEKTEEGTKYTLSVVNPDKSKQTFVGVDGAQ